MAAIMLSPSVMKPWVHGRQIVLNLWKIWDQESLKQQGKNVSCSKVWSSMNLQRGNAHAHLGKVWKCQCTGRFRAHFWATNFSAPMVVTVCSSEEEFQALAMRLAARVFLPRIVLLESNRWPYRVLTFLIHAIHYSVTILKALCKSKCSGVENGDASFPFLSSILQSTRKSTATLKNTVQISRKKTWKMSKYNRVKIWWLSKKLKSILKKNIENQAFHLVYFLKQGSTFFCKIVWLLWRQIIPSNWEDKWKM